MMSMSHFSSRLFVQIFFLSQVPGCSLCQSWPCQGRRWVGSQQQMLTWETMPSWSTPSWTESQGTPLTSPEPTKRPWSFWTRWEECTGHMWKGETLLKSPSEASMNFQFVADLVLGFFFFRQYPKIHIENILDTNSAAGCQLNMATVVNVVDQHGLSVWGRLKKVLQAS